MSSACISTKHSLLSFFDSFRIVAWRFTVYGRILGNIEPKFDDCGSVCGQTEKPAKDFCAGCPVKKAQDNFKKGTIKFLEQRLKGKWQKYGYENLLQTVSDVSDLSENLHRDRWTLMTERLIGILKSERMKVDRVDEFNRREPDRAKSKKQWRLI